MNLLKFSFCYNCIKLFFLFLHLFFFSFFFHSHLLFLFFFFLCKFTLFFISSLRQCFSLFFRWWLYWNCWWLFYRSSSFLHFFLLETFSNIFFTFSENLVNINFVPIISLFKRNFFIFIWVFFKKWREVLLLIFWCKRSWFLFFFLTFSLA